MSRIHMPSDLEYGSAKAAVAAGILTFIVLGWLSIYGWIIAGVVAGMIARGSLRGTVSAIVSGAIVSGVMIVLTLFVSPSLITTYTAYLGSSSLVIDIVGKVQLAMTMQPLVLIEALIVSAIVVPAIGGFIGGSIMSPRHSMDEEYEEVAEAAPE